MQPFGFAILEGREMADEQASCWVEMELSYSPVHPSVPGKRWCAPHACDGWWQLGKILHSSLHSEELQFESFPVLCLFVILSFQPLYPVITYSAKPLKTLLCKTLTAGQLCALPWRHETAKGSFYSHLFLCTIILWKTSRNQCFPFFLCVQQHKRDHCVWGWWSSGSVSDDLLLSLPFAFLPTAHCCRLILHTLHVICAEAEHVNTETWKGKLFFKVASKRFLFILFIQKLPHHWKERKNNTCENCKLLLIES